MYQRVQVDILCQRLSNPSNTRIQVVGGPRQTGKSTAVQQAIDHIGMPAHCVSAYDVPRPDPEWIRTEWHTARMYQRRIGVPLVLIFDEVQLADGWAETILDLWSEDTEAEVPIKVVLVGPTALLLSRDLQSLPDGVLEVTWYPQWSFTECREAFGYDLEDFLYLGGYPGGAEHRWDDEDWLSYMRDSVIDPIIVRDLADPPQLRTSLMRALLHIGAEASAQQIPYDRMMRQFDLMNTDESVTLARCMRRFDAAAAFRTLTLYQPGAPESLPSLPRTMVYDTAIMTAGAFLRRKHVANNLALRSQLVESAVGAYLLSRSVSQGYGLHWWRYRGETVDFVLSSGDQIVGIHVLSRRSKSRRGIEEFMAQYPKATCIVVGSDEPDVCPVEELLLGNVLLPV